MPEILQPFIIHAALAAVSSVYALGGGTSSCIDSARRKAAREGRRQGQRAPSGVSTMPSVAEIQTLTCSHQRHNRTDAKLRQRGLQETSLRLRSAAAELIVAHWT